MKTYKANNPKPGSHKIDLIGQKFGILTVQEFVGLNSAKNKLWRCSCDCGSTKIVTTTYLTNGKTTSCGCGLNRYGENSYNFSGLKEISGSKWYSIKQNAKSRNLTFTITKEQVLQLLKDQNYRCSLSNMKISFKDNTASVDRIDNLKGYEIKNISIVHKDINIIRNKFDIDYFKSLCKCVCDN